MPTSKRARAGDAPTIPSVPPAAPDGTLTLPAGARKLILPLPAMAEENDRRHRARGKLFKHPYLVLEFTGAKHPLQYRAYSIKGADIEFRMAFDKAPDGLPHGALAEETRLWAETTGTLELRTKL